MCGVVNPSRKTLSVVGMCGTAPSGGVLFFPSSIRMRRRSLSACALRAFAPGALNIVGWKRRPPDDTTISPYWANANVSETVSGPPDTSTICTSIPSYCSYRLRSAIGSVITVGVRLTSAVSHNVTDSATICVSLWASLPPLYSIVLPVTITCWPTLTSSRAGDGS